ncbi:translation initiation factor IF-2 [Porcipelethomonas sp.]|uniref:translation initiation factor IF-2 n=1 Tax=Porcipelethomonas sp. TaxID=2981675 RepID=UPI003EF6AD1E
MTKKTKLAEAAKDLKLDNQELIDLLEKYDGTKRKNTTALTSDEMNYILEHYSQNNQVESFDSYFESKNKPVQEEKEEVPQDEQVKKPVKKEKNASKTKSAKEAPAAEKTVKKPAEKKSENKKTEEKKNLEKKTAENKTAEAKKPEKTAQEQTKPKAQEQPVRSDASKSQKNDRFKKPEPAPVKKEKEKKQPPKAQKHGEKQKLGTSMSMTFETTTESSRRTVDTRGSYVNLDKYNERYEQIAPANKHKDNYTRKQKINQKSAQRNKNKFSSKRETESEKLRRLELERARKQQLKVLIPDEITVGELAARLKATATDVIKKLMGLGVMASINEVIDFDTAALVADEMGAKVEKEVIVTIEERLIDDSEDDSANTEERSPVVVVMGHVDHGKTSLLDRIRHANVTASEAGGITQHIGAYQVKAGDKTITFLDTPGHEAFTAMRARGADITDIAILVVAADDGIMPQTVESINHAKAANVSIIVAVNKMDKEGANIEKVKQGLTEHGLVPEEWGGDVMCVPVSAKTGEGIDELLEDVLLIAEMKELKANPDRLAKGAVIEARLDKGRGPVATLLVQNGTLKTGDVIIAGTSVGRVRVMTDYNGNKINSAGPSVPVEITGLAEVPSAGDTFNAVEDEKLAKELVEQRKHEAKLEQFNSVQKVTLDNLFSQIAQGEVKELPIIVKADVQGSVEAVKQSLEKLSNEEVRVKVIHGGVGAVSEGDVMLASASNAIIVGFNVRPDPVAEESAKRDGVEIRLYRIIYDAIEEITTAMKGMLAPKFREVILGKAEVRQVYKISSVGAVAGSYITDGKITRNCEIRVVRDGIVVAEDKISSLKRFKDDAKEVAKGFECGIGLEKFADIKEGDVFEGFIMEEYRD